MLVRGDVGTCVGIRVCRNYPSRINVSLTMRGVNMVQKLDSNSA
jgi:hypothetical protein